MIFSILRSRLRFFYRPFGALSQYGCARGVSLALSLQRQVKQSLVMIRFQVNSLAEKLRSLFLFAQSMMHQAKEKIGFGAGALFAQMPVTQCCSLPQLALVGQTPGGFKI